MGLTKSSVGSLGCSDYLTSLRIRNLLRSSVCCILFSYNPLWAIFGKREMTAEAVHTIQWKGAGSQSCHDLHLHIEQHFMPRQLFQVVQISDILFIATKWSREIQRDLQIATSHPQGMSRLSISENESVCILENCIFTHVQNLYNMTG